MKTLIIIIFFIGINLFHVCTIQGQDNSIIGKTICGYQAWFNCYGDGSPVERWVHWSTGQYKSNSVLPAPGNLTFEVYPDVADYSPTSLFQTGFANLGDGQPSVLYSASKIDVIEKHFQWMKEYGIDGVAVQKFLTTDGVFVTNRDTIAVRIRRAAEKYQRIFYTMYDISAADSAVFCNDLLRLETYHLTASPYYAHENGKPVICIWGFGITSRPDLPKTSLNIINWLKDKGYYVVGGVPKTWRTGTGSSYADYTNVYKAFNMISPWTVGSYKSDGSVDDSKTNFLIPDLAYCTLYGIEYQPVIFPGFAWSNWNGGAQNDFPRNKGDFFWRQLYNIKTLGIKSTYVAMFDEYDEGTAIAKTADSFFAIPTNQYFLTTSADGTYISSDFYLRLVGKASRVMKDLDPLTANVTIPYSIGPIFFRTSMEVNFDALPTWYNQTYSIKNVLGLGGVSLPQCAITINEKNYTGIYSLKYSGNDNSTADSYCYWNVFDVNIPVTSDLNLLYWLYPLNNNGRFVGIDLLMTDGTRLKDVNATDVSGLSMAPSQGRGVVNTWTETICNIGKWLNGKTIDKIMIGYDHTAETGDFSGYIDDITITTLGVYTAIETQIQNDEPINIFPNPVTNGKVTIDFTKIKEGTSIEISVIDMLGNVCLKQLIKTHGEYPLSLGSLKHGMYFISLTGYGVFVNKKIIIHE